jgi:hypothetical protein
MARFSFADAGVYCVQQTVSGTGVFDGTPIGYATYLYSAGGAAFKVRCPNMGTDGNGIRFLMVAPISDALVTTADYDQSSRTLRVFLKGTGGVITALASEVVAAINGMERPVLWAGLITEATIPVGVGPINLSGGLDPDVSAGYSFPKLIPTANVSGGLIIFDQTRPWKLLSVGGQFSAGGQYTVQLVNVDKALKVDTSMSVSIIDQTDSTSPFEIKSSRLDMPIMPGQAIYIDSDGTSGTVFAYGTAIAALDNIAD